MKESFVQAFARVAQTHASRWALEGAGQRITYAELLRAVRVLAQTLAEQGVQAGDHVGIQLPRGPDHVVAMLATWWLNAAWVPLDAEWPLARLELVLRELTPRVVISPGPGAWTCPTVQPHASAAAHAGFVEPSAVDLAYVIYTSGSTGAPKGVRVSHAGLCAVLRAQIEAFGLSHASRVLQVLSFGFDASVSDVGTALLAGATLVIDPGPLAASRIMPALAGTTHVDLPPALLARLDPATLPTSLQCVVVGGEVCAPDVLVAWAKRVRVVVVYGPTEATICSSLVEVDPTSWTGPSIGRPIAGFVYERDDDGELLVRGPGVALGYVDRSDLQRERFVRGAYRTGDRVLQRDDGSWEFAGRADRQRKLRGILVAPEEIEAVLCTHPHVERAAVIVRGERLLAFVVGAVTALEIHEHVQPRLPRGLRPHHVELVSSLPETASGKLDLDALARLPVTVQDAPFSPPRAGAESALASIWSRALGVVVGRDSTFLGLGGDSLAALEIVAAAEAQGLAVPSEALYRGLTLAEIACGELAAEPCTADALRLDARSERALLPAGPRRAGAPGTILLTGATGFFGARVLHELLATRDAPVVCVVRTGGLERITAALAVHGLTLADPSRVVVVTADLTQPQLGLSPQAYARLAAEIGSIHHVAAAVNLVLPYARLRAANLVATRNVLELATTERPKNVHYASTLSVAACVLPVPAVFHEHDCLHASAVFGGYAASKWAAEELVRLAADRLCVRTVRLGLLTGDSRTGRSARACQLLAFLRGLRALGAVPALAPSLAESLRVDVTPVDYAAHAFVVLGDLPDSAADTFHLASESPASWSSLMTALDASGPPLPRETVTDFRSRLAAATLDQSLATTVLAACRRVLGSGARHTMSDLFLASDVRFDLSRVRALGLRCPTANATLLAKYAREALS